MQDRLAADAFKQIFDSAPIGMAIVSLQGKFERTNRAFCELIGMPEKVLLTKNLQDITPPEELRVVSKLILGEARTYQTERRYIRGDGKSVFVLINFILVLDSSGIPNTLFLFAQDITALKSTEAELRSMKDQATGATKVKSEFLSMMSHEIRSPMNAILGMGELLLESKLNAEQKGYVETLLRAGENLMGMVHDVVDLSQIQSGELILQPEQFDLHDIVEKTVESFRARAVKKSLELSYYVDPRVPNALHGDPRRLSQVLVNLIGNAIKFTSFGGVFIRVSEEQNRARNFLFSIADTGMGISPSKQEVLFERTANESKPNPRQAGSSGVGLQISKQLIEMMGGNLRFVSNEGEGTTVFFSLNLEMPPSTAHRIKPLTPPKNETTKSGVLPGSRKNSFGR